MSYWQWPRTPPRSRPWSSPRPSSPNGCCRRSPPPGRNDLLALKVVSIPMPTPERATFLAGVIEGFYGPPWTQAERFELFDWMGAWGLNTYLYAPKDDLKHRALWREPYSAAEVETLAQLIQACQRDSIRFIYALSPGLDIRYSNESDLDHVRKRFEQMLALGCQHF